MHSVGVDIGGTFTDLVGIRDGIIYIEKASTVVDDPTKGVTNCVEGVDISLADIDQC